MYALKHLFPIQKLNTVCQLMIKSKFSGRRIANGEITPTGQNVVKSSYDKPIQMKIQIYHSNLATSWESNLVPAGTMQKSLSIGIQNQRNWKVCVSSCFDLWLEWLFKNLLVRMEAWPLKVSSQFDWRLFRSRVHSIETKGQFDRSKGCFDRRGNDDKNYSLASKGTNKIIKVLVLCID